MARQNQTHQRASRSLCKTCITAGAALLIWIALLISPLGDVVAAVTIFALVVVLFAIGCVNVREDDSKK